MRRRASRLLFVILIAMVPPARRTAAAQLPDHTQGQSESPLGGEVLTPEQRKLDPDLRDEIARRVGSAQLPVRVTGRRIEMDGKKRALVEIRARLLTQLARKIERLHGTVVSSSLDYRTMIAWVPVSKLELLAGEPTVSAIAPAPTSRNLRPLGR